MPYRIAIIGEAPGEDEESEGKPFVGTSGRFLSAILAKVGIHRDACYIGNVSQVRPPNNDIKLANRQDIVNGLAVLQADLTTFKPNLCLLLGGTPLSHAQPGSSITDWRGSLFIGQGPFLGFKCLATYHPAYILRVYSEAPLFHFDCKKAESEGRYGHLVIKQRNFCIQPTADQLLLLMNGIRVTRQPISIDIEGGVQQGMTCISIATDPSNVTIVPFFFGQWNAWEVDDEVRVWRTLAELLEDYHVPKILQNSLYDLFVVFYSYGICVRNIQDDTMLKHWELFCELEKSLAVQASIYTSEPFYKAERQTDNREQYFTYCCKDSAVTYEINQHQQKLLHGTSAQHYEFNKQLLRPLLYMELRGIAYDYAKATVKLKEVETSIASMQYEINTAAGFVLDVSLPALIEAAKLRFCLKKAHSIIRTPDDIVNYAKTESFAPAVRFRELVVKSVVHGLTHSDIATISTLFDSVNHDHPFTGLNINSSQQVADFLYRKLNLPIQYKKFHGRKTDKETTDVLALLNLMQLTDNPLLGKILQLRSLYTQTETLRVKPDSDGRIRCGYNEVGSETGRLSCYESPSGSGYNLQTVTKKARHLFRADPGYYFFQCDLAGADGWTVAAHCKRLGDPTMWDDYKAGLKPAKIVALMFEKGAAVSELDRPTLKLRCNEVDQDGWLYFGMKRVQHGTNYDMKENTMSDTILKDSYKLTGIPTVLAPALCKRLAYLYLSRYPGIRLWQNWVRNEVKERGYLISPSGNKRIFFGRRTDDETYKAALSHEPQNNTTYITNLAMLRLWKDPVNRRENGSLIIEPLHQVHDAICGQFPADQVDWAITRICNYFANEVIVAGQPLTIPFEGGWGPSWGELKNKFSPVQ